MANGTSSSGLATTTTNNNYITQPVVEHVVATTTDGVSESELDTKLNQLENKLTSLIDNWTATGGGTAPASSVPNSIGAGGVWNAIAGTNKIDNLSGVTISNSTIDAASIPDLSGSYLSVSGGTLSGPLYLTSASSSQLSIFSNAYFGSTATSTFTSAGWLGIGSSTPSYPLSVNGSAYLDNGDLLLGQVAPPVLNVPTATPSGSGNLNGTYYWAVTFVTAAGETNVTTSVLSTASPINQSVTLTNIPTSSDADVIARKIYRTVGNPADNNLLQFVTTINDDTTTTYVDNIADGSLGAAAPFINTTGGNISINGSRIAVASNFFTSFGANSMSNGTGYANSGFGTYTLYSNTTGLRNVALGVDAMYSNTTGNRNVAAGVHALNGNLSGSDNAAFGYAALFNATSTSGLSAFGASALTNNTVGHNNSAFGYTALNFNTTGDFNTAMGYQSLQDNTTASYNSAVGNQALGSNTTGGFNSALGAYALLNNTTGEKNSSVGMWSLNGNTTGYQNAAIGFQTLYANTTGYFNTAVGVSALINNTTGHHNTAFGTAVLAADTSGYYNTALGYKSGSGITIGAYNLILGANVDAPSPTGSQQLNIGNILYGTNLYNGSTVSSAPVSNGNLGVGTTSPYAKFSISANSGDTNTTLFAIASSTSVATTTLVSVSNQGNVLLGIYTNCTGFTSNANGLVSCTASDQRLKKDITALNASSTLAALDTLNPVSFYWKPETARGSQEQFGLVAQDVQKIFPNLVSTTSPTDLTPDGTLTVNYPGLIAPIILAIQQFSHEFADLAATVGGFAQSFTSAVGNFGHLNASSELCVGSTCVTPAQFQAMVAASAQGASISQGGGDTTESASDASNTPPVFQVNGNNPAYVTVGDTYNDLGAKITGPQADLNLGIKTFLNGALVSNIALDTSAVATDTIDYVVTDANSLTATSTRTVIIQAADAPSITPSDDTASSTVSIATSTPMTTNSVTIASTTTEATTTDATTTVQ